MFVPVWRTGRGELGGGGVLCVGLSVRSLLVLRSLQPNTAGLGFVLKCACVCVWFGLSSISI